MRATLLFGEAFVRRSLVLRAARVACVGAFALSACSSSSTSIPNSGGGGGGGKIDQSVQSLRAKINHIVVIYQENWSFDAQYGKFPGANGIANATGATQSQVYCNNG